MNQIIDRIEREAGIPGLTALLAELPPTDLQSVLLEVYRRRAGRLKPSAVLADYESNRFVRPVAVSPTELLAWEQVAFAHLPPEVQPIELSPVCPLGACSAVAAIDQNWAVATSRNTEVVSDSTNVLALECALRRREHLRRDPKSGASVHLAARHRLLRGQHYNRPDLSSHFSTFALCSAGRDLGHLRFEFSALVMHMRFYLAAVRAFLGEEVPLEASVTDLNGEPRTELIEEQLLAPLRAEFASVTFGLDQERTSGRGYYGDLCIHIHGQTDDGRLVQLVDGGCVDWTRRLLSNSKERLVTSGIGSEWLCEKFRRG